MTMSIDGPSLGASMHCEPVLRALPDWFGIEEALVQYVKDIETRPTFLVRDDDGSVVGFLTIKQHFSESAEILVMGVRSEWHRKGIGTALVERAIEWLRADGIEYVQVKTLSPARDCEHYERTRAFYRAVGFKPLEEFPTLWDPRNPCLIFVRSIT